jgi:hypothetical protein
MTTETGTLSGFTANANGTETKALARTSLGQSYPRQYPGASDALGDPLSIREVARLFGCSTWTVRHCYLLQGLPHLRSGPAGKLTFFRNQVVSWILQQQQNGKGGK